MAISLDDIKQLCMEGESSRLDYKREQYPFVGVSAPEKTELLKDFLAMVNAFRSEVAYILIGVAQQPGENGQIVGIPKSNYIDDAKLQEFINNKTNRIIVFSSYSVEIDSANIIQVIEIPIQQRRPYFPMSRLGEINANTVFIRSGSSTRIATPDEIALMGKEEQLKQNQREIEISLIVKGNVSGDIKFHARNITLADNEVIQPDGLKRSTWASNSLYRPITLSNKIDWLHDVFRTIRVDVALENKSPLSAEQLKVETFIPECSNECARGVNYFPPKPSASAIETMPVTATLPWTSRILHPGEYDGSFDILYFEVNHEGDFTLEVTVWGKDMPPVRKRFHIDVDYALKALDKNTIETLFEYIQDEDVYWQLLGRIQGDSWQEE